MIGSFIVVSILMVVYLVYVKLNISVGRFYLKLVLVLHILQDLCQV